MFIYCKFYVYRQLTPFQEIESNFDICDVHIPQDICETWLTVVKHLRLVSVSQYVTR